MIGVINRGQVHIIMELIDEYRQTLKKMRRALILNQLEIDALDPNTEDYDNKILELRQSRSNYNYYISNLLFAIQWMETGRMPGKIRGARILRR